MLIKRTAGASSALVVSGMLTFVFVGCFSDVQSLNSAAEAGFGGEEGNGVVGGSGSVGGVGNAPSAAGRASAGKGGKKGVAGSGSSTGGTAQSGAGGMAQAGAGSDMGGTGVVAGSSGTGAPFGGAGSGPVAGGGGSSGGSPIAGNAGYGGAGVGGTDAMGGRGGNAGSAGDGGGVGGSGGSVHPGAGSSGADSGGSAGTSGSGGTGAGGPCNSVDGSGCEEPTSFCIDTPDDCSPDAVGATSCDGECWLTWSNECDPYEFASCSAGVTWCHPDAVTHTEEDPHFICIDTSAATAGCDVPADCGPGISCMFFDDIGFCSPELSKCTGVVTCPASPPDCPSRHHAAIIDGCYGACVPLDHCTCETDTDCSPEGSCDRVTGTCKIAR